MGAAAAFAGQLEEKVDSVLPRRAVAAPWGLIRPTTSRRRALDHTIVAAVDGDLSAGC